MNNYTFYKIIILIIMILRIFTKDMIIINKYITLDCLCVYIRYWLKSWNISVVMIG